MSFGSSYPIKPVGQFAEVKGGKRLPAGHSFSSDKTDHLYIRAQDVRGGRIMPLAMHIEKSTFEMLQRYRVKTGDVCITIAGNIGDIGYVNEEFDGVNLTENAVKLSNLQGVNARYLTYALQLPEVQAEMKSAAAGAAQPKLGIYKVNEVMVPIPADIFVQNRISTILSDYDDLIETNRRRIALLEESARLLYREWFIKLRFPEHEFTKVVDDIPEGWSKGSVVDFVSIMSGGTPNTKSDSFWGGDIPFFTPKDCTDSFYVSSTEKTLTESGLNSCNSRLFPKETIFITARGTVGKLTLAQQPMAMNQSCYALAPKAGVHIDNLFLFLAMLDAVAFVKQMATGGVFDTIVVDTFKKIPFLCPDTQISLQFGLLIRPIFAQIENLHNQNLQLALARDALLPKLMSGQLAV